MTPSYIFSVSLLLLALTLLPAAAFMPHRLIPKIVSSSSVVEMGEASNWARPDVLFEEDPEMIDVAEHYIRSKYKSTAKAHGHSGCTKEDVEEILRQVLPPVTPEELYKETQATLKSLMKDPEDESEIIDENRFVKAIVNNSYWAEAGDLVVKELIYFDTLYNFYHGETMLLNNDDYEELKENLTWEGSSVPTMNKNEALFVSAVAASRRCEPLMDNDEYQKLKKDLQAQGSWVTNRGKDALEKIHLETFMGYLHRSLAVATDIDCVN